MHYVIYHKPTTYLLPLWLVRNHVYRAPFRVGMRYTSERAAKAALTRTINGLQLQREQFAVMEASKFHAEVEKKEKRIGIGPCAGVEYEVGVNTSWTSGPWSETYWAS